VKSTVPAETMTPDGLSIPPTTVTAALLPGRRLFRRRSNAR